MLILSIMAGFLEESRRTLRGNLADLVIQPSFQSSVLQENGDWVPMQTDVERMLEIIREDPDVVAATPSCSGTASSRPTGGESALEKPMQDAIQLIELVGIDVEGEGEATDFRESLEAEYGKKPGMGKFCNVGRPEDVEDPFVNLRDVRQRRDPSQGADPRG